MKNMQIRINRLQFTLEFPEQVTLPENKESAIRGGMGQMLLAQNCVTDQKCEDCSFREECIVQKIMYAKYKIVPAAVTSESAGFVLSCLDKRTEIKQGGQLRFTMTLFGNTILYFSQILNALHALGQQGLGSASARYRIVGIHNRKDQPILRGNRIQMRNYRIETLQDYVDERCSAWDAMVVRLHFLSPFTSKYCSAAIETFSRETAPGVINAISRRVHMLMLYEGIETEELRFAEDEDYHFIAGESERVSVRRYSSVKRAKMELWGVRGYLEIEVKNRWLLEVLMAGELAQAGKNTRFGFGVYRVEPVGE